MKRKIFPTRLILPQRRVNAGKSGLEGEEEGGERERKMRKKDDKRKADEGVRETKSK